MSQKRKENDEDIKKSKKIRMRKKKIRAITIIYILLVSNDTQIGFNSLLPRLSSAGASQLFVQRLV